MRKIKTKKLTTVNEKTLIVTVDLGKITNTGYYRFPDGSAVEPFEFFNNGRGFNTFWQYISKAKQAHKLQDMVIGFESTGPYGEPLLHYLRLRKTNLVQVNPMHTKRLKELQGNSPNKTDKKDPKVIADIIALGHGLSLVVPEGPAAQLRRLTQAREKCMKRHTLLLNQLHDLVFILFPECFQAMNSVKGKSIQYLLTHYPTPLDIVKLGVDPLTLLLKKISRGTLGEQRARALYEAAAISEGVQEAQDSIVFEIRGILALIAEHKRFITRAEKLLGEYLQQIPYSRSILALKGIGTITAAGLIGEVGDFTKFSTIAEIMKLAGLDLFEISSGKHQGRRRISKRGRALMRKLLYFAALNVVRKGGLMHAQYHSYLNRGMVKTKALIAIARKLLRIIFAIVRDHSEYRKDYAKTPTLKQVA